MRAITFLHPEIAEIDLSPVIVAESKPVVADAGLYGQNHRALDDARMTALIWMKLQEQ